MLVDSTLDDIVLSGAFTGLPASWLRGSIAASGLDPDQLAEQVDAEQAAARFHAATNGDAPSLGARRWTDIWSAGHSVSGVDDVPAVAEVVARLREQYIAAQADAAGAWV
jgi:nitronate monooxygenase